MTNKLFEKANSLFLDGFYAEAAVLFRDLIAKGLNLPRATHGLAVTLFHLERENEALDLLGAALQLDPDYADAYLSLGNMHLKCGLVSNAISAYRKCLDLKPDNAQAWNNLGNALKANGEIGEALCCYQRAAEHGDKENAIVQKATLLSESYKHDEAASILRNGLEQFPNSAKITLGLIWVLYRQQHYDEALILYETSRNVVDNLPERRQIIAGIYQHTGRLEEALELMQDDLKNNSLHLNIRLNTIFALFQAGRNEDALSLFTDCHSIAPSQQYKYLSAYQFALTMSPASCDQEIFDVAKQFADSLRLSVLHVFSLRPDRSAGVSRPFRIGYISPDFRRHPVGFHILPVLRNHDSAKFQIYCYNDCINQDEITAKIQECTAVWRNIKKLTDEQLADVIRSDAIDILIDLAGHSADNRLRVFAMRPAAVQISWLGYWATTGLETIDYVISDSTTIPDGGERFFVERVWRLPGCRFCYSPPEYSPDVKPLPANSNGYITYGCFNNVSKLNDDVIALWALVLKAVTPSRLVLKWRSFSDQAVCERFLSKFVAHGISANRLTFRSESTHVDMLAEYSDIDIALDPFPFSGGMTSCEALWMGVPVITLPGSRPISRQTAAYLSTIGLEGFIAENAHEYVETAIYWSNNYRKLENIRASMRQKMLTSTLCRGKEFTQNLEQAYAEMFEEVRQRPNRTLSENDPPAIVDLEQLFPEESYHEAMSLFNQGLFEQARSKLEAAIRVCNYVALWHNDLGNILAALERPYDAMEHYREAIRLNDRYPEAHYNLGLELQNLGQMDEALVEYQLALDIHPDFIPAQSRLTEVLKLKNMREHSHTLGEDMLNLYNAANNERDSGNLSRAQQLYEKCLITAPDFAPALNNLGIVLASSGNAKAARQRFQEAIEIDPADPDPHNNLGRLLMEQRDYLLAAASFREALMRQPNHAEALSNLSFVYTCAGQISLAIEAAEKALVINPEMIDAKINLGRAWINAGDVIQGLSFYREAVALAPLKTELRSNIFYSLHYLAACEEEISAELDCWKSMFTDHNQFGLRQLPSNRSCLKIGYVSPDMGRHPVGFHLLPVLRHHDHSRLQIVCYSDRTYEDDISEDLSSYVDVWRQTSHLSDEALAHLIVSDNIDILIDLAGHTANNRLRVFAMKPARIQISWLGYWGTTGLKTMDYVVSDSYTVPLGAEHSFVEKIVRLPGCRFCYSPPDYAPDVAPLPASKNGYITFGSFNNIAKINENVISLWVDVLKTIPDSRLVLKWHTLADQLVKKRIIALFKDKGVAQDRLELRSSSPHAEMLSEYGDVDIALDPFPFNGGMTTCEALWMGVPVLTLSGDRPVSRQTFAFLKTIGLDGFNTFDVDEFVSRAIYWSHELEKLQLIRSRLRTQMVNSLLCDGEAFTLNLETALIDIAAKHPELAHIFTPQGSNVMEQRTVLNVGGGNNAIPIPPWFHGWRHLLLDIDPVGSPDIVADARDLFHLEPASIDAVYCSHNLEHYMRHHAVKVLQGFCHILNSTGFLDVRVPDLGDVIQRVVTEGLDLDDELYLTGEGIKITVHDVLYGWGKQMEESGEEFYAHRCGFTEPSLRKFLHTNGFPYVATRCANMEVQAFAFVSSPEDDLLTELGIPRSEVQSSFDLVHDSSQMLDQAHAAWDESDFEGAAALCESILEEDQECVDAYLILGEYSLQINKTDDAVSYFRTALLFDPDSVQGIVGLTRSLEVSGDVDGWQSCLADAKERFPELEDILNNKN
ncbi:MAG: tetratricopeptide repeat protein [Chitinophagaceae bacterium]|nr:tetratricopeptide repeat protein [Chitinophagaceae bacterium]